ncbi:hypothetical protein B1A99_10560 [Cohnella sp. CIP 111063]|jgi:class 3 adenylate cyclase|uniref:hypothetical protein n=1 Tax=unclassified Cohnella TaxID=2636738 RepID=UPI000B8BC918|nr:MULTISPECIES: hypothetical protein [unclassified Cohnella]OXS59962.1 hypothetical protein B1A99_10560 [Cohnella sp. CIP 111063]PRX72772.1 hypothetical protein B0G52_105328 [Cohnella sp. SGD-V74]
MQQAESVRTTYESLMERTRQLVQRKEETEAFVPSEEQYAVLHLTVEADGQEGGDRDLSRAQIGVRRFVTVIAQIVSGWGGQLIEASHQSYTAIFPMSEADAVGRSCLCGVQIVQAIDAVINPSLAEEGIPFRFRGGVGVSMGRVYSFHTGLSLPANSLYYGEAMTSAVEYANMTDGQVIVDKVVKEHFERSGSEYQVQFVPYRYHEWVGYRFHIG